jgi:hypothetical protein
MSRRCGSVGDEVFTEEELLDWISLISHGGRPVSVWAIASAKAWAFERVEAEVERLAREGKLSVWPGAIFHALHGEVDGYAIPVPESE